MKYLSLGVLLLFVGQVAAKKPSIEEVELQVLKELLTEKRITQLEYNQKKARLDYKLQEKLFQPKPVLVDNNKAFGGTASITGTVKVGGLDVEDFIVTICENNLNNCFSSEVTDQFGSYSFANLTAGTYFIIGNNDQDDYLNSIWAATGSEVCFNCQPDADNEIVLVDAESRVGVELNLTTGASISGLVVEGSNTISGKQVNISNLSGTLNFYGFTDGAGIFTTSGIPADDYYATISSVTDIYIDAMWSNSGTQQCYYCNPDASNTITLAAAEVRTGIDFDLVIGASITGQVTEAVTANPVETMDVRIVDPLDYASSWNAYAVFDGSGNYMINGVPAGDYKVYLDPRTDVQNLHIPEIYNNIQCNACTTLILDGSGDVLNLVNGVTTSNIDFEVEVGASISGIILNNDYPTETVEQFGLIYVFNDANRVLALQLMYGTDLDPSFDGQFKVGGLLPGMYFVQGGDLGREFFQRELFENIHCPWSGCDRGGGGDPVVLGVGEQRLGVNYFLNYGGKISGTVTDASSGMPIATGNNYIQFYDATGAVAGGAYINEDGTYISARALPPGSYSARTGSMFTGDFISPYVMEKYAPGGNIDCPGVTCDLTAGNIDVFAYDPLNLNPEDMATTSGIDFALSPAFSFSGTITELSSTNPIPEVHVLVYDDSGNFANWATTDAAGEFTVQGLPAGTYYALTNNGSNLPFMGLSQTEAGGWIDILFDGTPCPGSACDVTTGDPIVLGAAPFSGNSTNGSGPVLDFSLSSGATITGQVRNFNDQLPASGVQVNVYNSNGDFYGSYVTDTNGYYMTVGFPAGSYYLITVNNGALLDAKYGGEYCWDQSCDPLDATPIVVAENQAFVDADFDLKPDYIFKSGLE